MLSDSVIAPITKTVKHGKKINITDQLENSGDLAASGAKICAATKSKQVTLKKCKSIGALDIDQVVSKTFSVTVGAKAKKGRKAVLTFTGSASGVEKVTGKSTITFK